MAGMGNRFATLTQYHSMILAHGVMGVIVFLFLVPFAVMTARFYRGPVGRNVRYHVYFQILSIIMLTVVFILGFFAVGPNRSLTNPHHGIGVALYVMLLVQAIGGVMVRHIKVKSLRLMFHRWLGRIITLLGVIQIPLGLTLYGSPKYTFILYAVWVAFLFLLYFVLSYRHELEWNRDDRSTVYGGRSEVGRSTIYNGRSEVGRSERSGWTTSGRTEETEHGHGWLGPLAAGAAAFSLFRGRKDRKERARSRSRSRSRGPEVLPSRPPSSGYLDEKYVARDEARPKSGGGFMSKFAGAVGAGALAGKFMGRKDKAHDDEYQSVATDTPRNKTKRPIRSEYTESEFTDEMTDITRSRRGGPILPGPGNSVSLAGARSAAEERPRRPLTPRQTHARPAESRLESNLDSDYSSYVSPSRKAKEEQEQESGGGVGKGVLGALGLGWFAKKLGGGGKEKAADEERGKYEEERRDGRHGSKFTADGYGSPGRKGPRRYPPTAGTQTTMTGDSELSSAVESQPAGYKRGFPPMPHSRPPQPPSSVDMPDIPPDNHGHGILHQSETGSEAYGGRPQRRRSSRRGSRRPRDGSQAAAEEAAASAGLLAAEEERRRARSSSRGPGQPDIVSVRYHEDRDRNVTLRRLTEEEAARERRRRRSDSASSMSGGESSGRRRYRRDSDAHRSSSELTARNDAGARRGGNNAAYYPPSTSGPPPPPPPPGPAPFLGPGGTHMHNNPTVSSIGSHGTWSAMSPSPSGPNDRLGTGDSTTASAADRRKARRAERRQNPRPSLSGTDMYD